MKYGDVDLIWILDPATQFNADPLLIRHPALNNLELVLCSSTYLSLLI
jgi:hypothetical protein